MTSLIILGSTFGVVLALGLQSLSVNGGHRLFAFVNSLVISAFNLALLKLVPTASEPLEFGAYMLGGPLGIVAAMAAHPVLLRWFGMSNGKTGAQ